MKRNGYFSRLLTLIVVLSIYSLSVFAQSVQKHTVERGETLVTIAEKYSMSKEDLIKANPDAAQFLYVGMELTIPNSKNENIQTQKNTVAASTTINESSITSNYSSDDSSITYQGKSAVKFELAFGLLPKETGVNGSSYEYRATIGCDYFVADNIFIGGRIGYNSANYIHLAHAEGTYVSTKSVCHLLCIPLEIGYSFNLNQTGKFSLLPFVGADLNIGLSGKNKWKIGSQKEQSSDMKIGGKIGIGIRVGMSIYLSDWLITGALAIPVNNNQKGYFGKKAYPEIGLGWKL